METLLTLAYVATAFVCLGSFLISVRALIRKRKQVSDHLIRDTQALAILAAVLLCAFFQYQFLTERIPDGEYEIYVRFRSDGYDTALCLPADLIIDTNEDFEDSVSYHGAYESETFKRKVTRSYYLYRVYMGARSEENAIRIDRDVKEGEDNELNIDYGLVTVNIGVISPERLGITAKGNWESSGVSGNIEFISVMVTGVIQLVQYCILDKERKRASDK